MTYYQVEFLTVSNQPLQPRRFRTEERAKKHAKRVPGISDETGLASKAIIVPVNRTAAP
jgi:hypothetical protein